MQELMKRYRWYIGAAFCGILLISGLLVYKAASRPVITGGQAVAITVKPGMNASDIAQLLYQKGVIQHTTLFHLIAKIERLDSSLQAGDYVFSANMTLLQVVDRLGKGEVSSRQITIPEGYTVAQIAKLLQDEHIGNAETFKKLAKTAVPYAYMQNTNPNVSYQAEGFLFPDTYQIARGASEEKIMQLLMGHFDKQFTPAMRQRAEQMGLSVREVIILASLVEKEAQIEKDRPLIAGVFLNRLRQDMPLQSCATIQYILGYPKPELTVQDTEIASPYNTYQHGGLPPGPIANPGLAAIKAVLYPEKTDYLYFVADKKGAHHFSRTYEEHLAMIEQVQ